MLYGCCVTWSPRACHNDVLRRDHHIGLTRCIGSRENNRTDHTISYLHTVKKTGFESIEAIKSRRRILFMGFMARVEDTRLPKRVRFGALMGGASVVGRRDNESMSLSSGRPQSFRYQRRPVDNYCSPGRAGLTQDGGTRGATFHAEMDRCCRESQN